MKKLMTRIIIVTSLVMAFLSIASACMFWTYQPELPQLPRRD